MIDITNLTKDYEHEKWFRGIVIKAIKHLKIKKTISVVLVGDKKIRELNRVYRKKDRVTDVLSFGDWQTPGFLGEIVISLPQIKRQAGRYRVSAKEELARMLIHGVLHLVGFNHEKSKKKEKEMIKKQERLMRKILRY